MCLTEQSAGTILLCVEMLHDTVRKQHVQFDWDLWQEDGYGHVVFDRFWQNARANSFAAPVRLQTWPRAEPAVYCCPEK